MQKISPVKLIAGIAAVLIAVVGLFAAGNLRQGAADMFKHIRLPILATKPAQPAASAPASARASGVKVIPIGVTDQASAPGAAK